MLRSDLCDYNDAYVVTKRRISVTNNANRGNKKLILFKKNASLRSCISKINNAFIDKAKDLDNVM